VVKDRDWAVENDKGFEVEYIFDFLVYISKVQKEIKAMGGGKKKIGSQGICGQNDEDITWYNYEDQVIKSKSVMYFFTEDKGQADSVKGENNFVTGKCVMIIKYSDYENIVKTMV